MEIGVGTTVSTNTLHGKRSTVDDIENVITETIELTDSKDAENQKKKIPATIQSPIIKKQNKKPPADSVCNEDILREQ